MRTVSFITGILFLSFSSLSQNVSIKDSAGQPVPFATVEIPKKRMALFADASGVVKLSLKDLLADDTLTISSIGFNTLIVAANRIGTEIILEKQVIQLQEAFIYNGEWKKENWGSLKKPKDFGVSFRMEGPGSQIGKIIKSLNGNKKPAWIYKVAFYTNHAENSRSPVRLRIYKIDKNGLPGNDILTESIIERIDKGKGWLEFDLSENEIKIPDGGLIIAAEYFDTDVSNWNSHKTQYIDSTGKKYKFDFKWYGGNFVSDDETNQGMTMIRHNGSWLLFNYLTAKKPGSKNLFSNNLVLQVWVRTPE